MNGKAGTRTAIVTGASGKIGAAIAEGLVEQGFQVILVARASSRLDQVARRLSARAEPCDLSLRDEIAALAARITEPIDVLVNDAAQCPRERIESAEGIELQFATNVLGYFRMIEAFRGHLGRAAPARVVNVASYWAGGLDLDDLEFRQRRYDNDAAYRQSKQADRMLTASFAPRLAPLGISVNACHPGDVNSKLSNDLGFGGHESPAQGARTPLFLATSDAVSDVTGRYFAGCERRVCEFGSNTAAVEALHAVCEQMA